MPFNIGGIVDCKAVAQTTKSLPGVKLARDYTYMCSKYGQELIRNAIKNKGINLLLFSRRYILIVLKEKIWESTPSIIPVKMENPHITSTFGWRRNPLTDRDEFHAGIDILGSRWDEIVSPAAGVVINIGYDQWLGNYIVIQQI